VATKASLVSLIAFPKLQGTITIGERLQTSHPRRTLSNSSDRARVVLSSSEIAAPNPFSSFN